MICPICDHSINNTFCTLPNVYVHYCRYCHLYCNIHKYTANGGRDYMTRIEWITGEVYNMRHQHIGRITSINQFIDIYAV